MGPEAERERRLLLFTLLDGGDWACAHGDGDGLVMVADRLSKLVGEELAMRARGISILGQTNLLAASMEWGQLAGQLRR